VCVLVQCRTGSYSQISHLVQCPQVHRQRSWCSYYEVCVLV
jgi:hypothetical protein